MAVLNWRLKKQQRHASVNDVEMNHIEGHASTPATGTDHVSTSAGGLLVLAANDIVDLRVKSLDAAANYDPDKAQLVIHRISP